MANDKYLSEHDVEYIIARIIDNANDCIEEMRTNKGDLFYEGKSLAYYEVLDTVKNTLLIYGQTLSQYGLRDNMEYLLG